MKLKLEKNINIHEIVHMFACKVTLKDWNFIQVGLNGKKKNMEAGKSDMAVPSFMITIML